MNNLLGGIRSMYSEIGASLDAQGGFHICNKCGDVIRHEKGDGAYYTSHGYPKCCGRTRMWITDDKINNVSFTAWQLCGDWWWVGHYYIKPKNGRALYEDATATKNGMVFVRRLDKNLHQINRYLPPDQMMELVPIRAGS